MFSLGFKLLGTYKEKDQLEVNEAISRSIRNGCIAVVCMVATSCVYCYYDSKLMLASGYEYK